MYNNIIVQVFVLFIRQLRVGTACSLFHRHEGFGYPFIQKRKYKPRVLIHQIPTKFMVLMRQKFARNEARQAYHKRQTVKKKYNLYQY